MRFLIDNALSPRLASLLVAEGYDAIHVRTYSMQAARDEDILARALAENRIVVSSDSDFGAILAAQEAEHPSFILFREADLLAPGDYADILTSALPALTSELLSGCVAVFRRGRLRVRKLPLSW